MIIDQTGAELSQTTGTNPRQPEARAGGFLGPIYHYFILELFFQGLIVGFITCNFQS
jgi:hypothetical protein